MKIVFMGTPDFAVPCLQEIIDSGEEVVGVYSQPDKPRGRGHKVQPPPVKELAVQYQIPVFQPASLRTEEAQRQLKALAPDLVVVVAYGKILPTEILQIPPLGCVNVHASLLPKYRGAGPIQWSVLNGETETGVTTMYMEEGLDTGDMILSKHTEIGKDETASELHDRLSVLGAEALRETLPLLAKGTAPCVKQDDQLASYAPMLTKELCEINFAQNAALIHNQIRGLSTWPCATTTLLGKRLKVYRSELVEYDSRDWKPGEILCNKTFIVGCAEKTAIRFTEVQFEGSKRMSSQDFLRGKSVEIGSFCGEK